MAEIEQLDRFEGTDQSVEHGGVGAKINELIAAHNAKKKMEYVSVGPANDTTVAVVMKVVDQEGNDVPGITRFDWWLSGSATTAAPTATTPDGGVSFTPGAKLENNDLGCPAVTDADGDVGLTVIHSAGAVDYYLWTQVGDGDPAVSGVISIT